ncbi:nucleoside 2-deoxyribosyltransferase [Amnibacterium kyonggiense]|uniref:Nucleoside 2-deoxyribosyltransferase n=1 Tax=Amnibacterium kyonggiense TaxID=595671 RepID=A0A4R7FLD3_9MICO|nr:nucleoside 2-deoxyribosyltransferase [Amnibacterium kyonggiense]TDS77222.1 nucleoside 2-deoxyribosyltransferase [Amnibacterium kyonggiense]
MSYAVYLAGPEVFHADVEAIAEAQRSVCRAYGLVPISPADKGLEDGDQSLAADDRIFANNIEMIERADAVVANIDPFRGPDPDAGTAFEVGYAHGRGKPIYAWTADTATAAERVERLHGPLHTRADGALADRDGLMVEGFGGPVNLMLVSPATVVLGTFEDCIRRVAADIAARA